MARRYGRGYGYDRYESRFPVQPTVGEVAARAAQASKKLGAKQELQPVFAEGRKLASTWWGQSWNANLERYADYTNRLPRGRSYLRYGAVLDLRLAPGQITGLVQGSMSKPYEISIRVAPLKPAIWDLLRQQALGQLDSLTDLLTGRFPDALKSLFFAQGQGLFPEPGELTLDCSCPDWSDCCKHVAAVLYGVGVRLDTQPDLLFVMRQVSTEELIKQTVTATAAALVRKGDAAASGDVLADSDVAGVFGITMDETIPAPAAPKAPQAAPAPAAAPAAKTPAKTPAKGKASKAQAAAERAAHAEALAAVESDRIRAAIAKAQAEADRAAAARAQKRAPATPKPTAAKASPAPAQLRQTVVPPAKPIAAAKAGGKTSKVVKSAALSAKPSALSTPKAAATKPTGPAKPAAPPVRIFNPGKPKHGEMATQFMHAIADLTGPFDYPAIRARFPEWTDLQVRGSLARCHALGSIYKVGHGQFRRR